MELESWDRGTSYLAWNAPYSLEPEDKTISGAGEHSKHTRRINSRFGDPLLLTLYSPLFLSALLSTFTDAQSRSSHLFHFQILHVNDISSIG